MVAPITYKPYVTGVEFLTPSIANGYWRKMKSAQKAPYIPAVYDFIRARTFYSGVPPGQNTFNPPIDARTFVNLQYDSDMEISTTNRSYENLRSKMYSDASLGVDFAESRQSFSMITRAATTLGRSFLQVKKLDFVGAAKTLRMTYVPKGVSTRKSAANNWLEFHFGWTPLVKSVYDAA
jgi:hypothetical protein